MKAILVGLLMVFPLKAAEPFRQWTQAESKRSIFAKIADKTDDSSKAKVVTQAGKVHWLVASTLIEEDQEYILKWMPEVDHLTVRVTGGRKGVKDVKLTVIAGAKDLTVEIDRELHSSGPTIHQVEAKATSVWDITVINEYKVTVTDSSGVVVDEEAWNKKTGL